MKPIPQKEINHPSTLRYYLELPTNTNKPFFFICQMEQWLHSDVRKKSQYLMRICMKLENIMLHEAWIYGIEFTESKVKL